MFTRCIHCCADLGRNERIEHFPVGERLAFDSAKGRLWVICPHCARWNLTPLEERWEAVEECERLFRGQRLRAQTPNIGFVTLADGLGLVRIGRPLRPEMAAWRYGREFSRRRTRAFLTVGAAAFGIAGVAIGGVYLGAAALIPHLGMLSFEVLRSLAAGSPTFDLQRGPGREWTVDVSDTMILPDPEHGWMLNLRHHFGRVEYRGADAERMLAIVMTHANDTGGSDRVVQRAVSYVQEYEKKDIIVAIARTSQGLWEVDGPTIARWNKDPLAFSSPGWSWNRRSADPPRNRAGLSHFPVITRLALEMSMHEQSEQRAIEGELADLEAAWREAEEIAGIADNLLLPPGADEFIARHRAGEKERGRG